MREPLIFDIKRASTTDGPGARTVVFLKGCNLDCFWCHNPEGKAPTPQLAYFKEKCVSCGACGRVCEGDRQRCFACGACARQCPENARRLYGRSYTAEELFEIIRSDQPYYDATGGGVTFSGGECMLYPDYVADVARQCHRNGISVAVDTAGCVPYASFEKVLPYVELFLYDIKCLDPILHKSGTGKENDLILRNLELLRKTGKQILIRVPVIPGFNEGGEIKRIMEFCEERKLSVELLPYHAFGEDKKGALAAELLPLSLSKKH